MERIQLGIVSVLKRKNYKYSVLVILIIFLGFNFFLVNINARKETIVGFSTQDMVQPNEKVSYRFLNNITFEISSNTLLNLSIEYENNIEDRQTYFIINNSNPLSLNISSKTSLQNFGVMQAPKQPQMGNFRFQYRYNCIYRISSNTSIENVTIRYRKLQY